MDHTAVTLNLQTKGRKSTLDGIRVGFSPHQCFLLDGNIEEVACLGALERHLKTKLPGLVFVGRPALVDYFLRHMPELKGHVDVTYLATGSNETQAGYGFSSVVLPPIPEHIETVFLCETLNLHITQLREQLPNHVAAIDLSILPEIALSTIPKRGWTPQPRNIYPIKLPEIKFSEGLDFILMDCPSRNLALMPNGIGYVNSALKKTSVSYQILDLDNLAYHRFHIHRLFDKGGAISLPSGQILPEDPWQAEHYDLWTTPSNNESQENEEQDLVGLFQLLINEVTDALIEARPKVVGFSLQGCNEPFTRKVVKGLKAALPDLVVVVGGFSCYNPDIGLKAFPDADYMCIGEADSTIGPLIEALVRNETPKNQPGVISRFDSPDHSFLPAPMIHKLDQIEFPKYDWADLTLYRNFNGYQLVPIIASRGCRWSRCTFCAERFYWRIRTPENFADELEWLVAQGCHLFMFNESDLNGNPDRVLEICDEIIRRGLHKKTKLTGQLRIHKGSDKAFFQKLHKAGFVALRFGVDAFSENTLRLQKKGYTVDMISQNLRDCWEAGIYTEVNWVIGVPGETEQDIEEGIDLILSNAKYIGRLANINPLILSNGGVYWIDPEAHNIKFRESKDILYDKFPRALPADSWWSEEPYIDAQVRKERFERIVTRLHDAKFPIGAWAEQVIDDVKTARDRNRSPQKITLPEEKADSRQETSRKDSRPSNGSNYKEAQPVEELTKREGRTKWPAEKLKYTKNENNIETPIFVRRNETHSIYMFDGEFYAVPNILDETEINHIFLQTHAGVIKSTSEHSLLQELESSSKWSDSRGQYDSQQNQRDTGSYLRAGSALGQTEIAEVQQDVLILRYQDIFISVNQEDLDKAFSRDRIFGNSSAGSAQLSGVSGGGLIRRLAMNLPGNLTQAIHRTLQQRKISQADSRALASQSDSQLIYMAIRGISNKAKHSWRFGTSKRSFGKKTRNVGSPVPGHDCRVMSVVTKDAAPELMWSDNGYNVVEFDGMYYGLPHGIPIDWQTGCVGEIPGVISGSTVDEVVKNIPDFGVGDQQEKVSQSLPGEPRNASRDTGDDDGRPKLLESLETYNLVSYEGWIYGLPHELGPVDLADDDVMSMDGVIRDVSKYAVEAEINARSSLL